MNSNQIRASFLEFFRTKGHTVVPSSPLVPANDPTLLFTNAGMVQFKDVFLGRDKREYVRAASSQRCVRAGGKHNDLENVGYTARHHTFFEMLGNFSFGDYFKREAIEYAWELLTSRQWWNLPKERLWVTVYHEDDEAHEIWTRIFTAEKLPLERIVRIGDKAGGAKYQSDNFWQMADTGPCGPCTEIFYDHGPEVAGGPPGSAAADGDRYIEIWNLVFMQFDRAADGTLTPLPKPCVDTGMGLERIAAVLQGVHSNYETDVFKALIEAAAKATGARTLTAPSLRVIADHIRACSFLIVDGVVPSNEGRGYVLRRIIRRAIRHGYKLGQHRPFFHELVEPLAAQMGEAYPELQRARDHVAKVLLGEEERFAETLDQGMRLLESALTELDGRVIPGETVFKLYDTYGFPVDLTADIARERGLTIDQAGFERAMEAQRERARAASQFGTEYAQDVAIDTETCFTGYEKLVDQGRIVALFRGREPVEVLRAGEQGIVVLDSTPFYAESGGQVGDRGVLRGANAEFRVEDTQKRGGGAFAHLGTLLMGDLRVGEIVEARVDENLRRATVLNHSATHLLHAALRKVLGTHVVQKGSLVAPDRLRFDFSHPAPLTREELRAVEDLVNEKIRENAAADVRHMSYDEALRFGAIALFGEKYGSTVRVMKFGDFSTELCGGTHVRRTGDIGLFKIVSESGVAAGIRRIEAVTGAGALAYIAATEETLGRVAALVKGGRENLEERVKQLIERTRRLEREVEQLKAKLATGTGGDLADRAVDVAGCKVLAARLDGADAKALREAVDRLKDKLGSAAIVLAAVEEGKVRLVAGVTKDRMTAVPAGELVNMVASQVGGKGGGRPDLAQAGGTDPSRLDHALEAVPEWVRQRLG
ncbi:MAG TPA: alanine--tRNA ligase [Gammaproteobacteria bacterium]|nr:alanine--tRNA ligase [Gammaproteobacteria bacterium]